MKKILIIYPHFPPSNLAGVHRARLFAQHLPSFGWQPTILTVDEKYYEENLDYNLVKLLPNDLRIEKVNAYKRIGPVGDIGIRAFLQLYKKAKYLLQNEKYDFVYIPIPSFYCALLGRLLYKKTKVKYGIDYIDPWVHNFPGSDKKFSRHWFSTKLAKILEPIAIKNASLITGVAEGYYQPVLERNPHLKNITTGAMPYGGEEKDHEIIASLNISPYLFKKNDNKFQLIYAGAMLPKAYEPLEKIFESIAINKNYFDNVEFHFIGTGKITTDANSFNIKPLAEKYGLWNTIIFEYPARIPYLDVLVHLNIADAVFILGSTEPHYTPSKVYQGVLSAKPIFAILHELSSAKITIEKSNTGIVLPIRNEELKSFENNFLEKFNQFKIFMKNFDSTSIQKKDFAEYSSFSVTKKLVELLNSVK